MQVSTETYKVATFTSRVELMEALAKHGLSGGRGRPATGKLAEALGVAKVVCTEPATKRGSVNGNSTRTLTDVRYVRLNSAGKKYGGEQTVDSLVISTATLRDATGEAPRRGRYSNQSWTAAIAAALKAEYTKGKDVEVLSWTDPHTTEVARTAEPSADSEAADNEPDAAVDTDEAVSSDSEETELVSA